MGILLVYDVTDERSFNSIFPWFSMFTDCVAGMMAPCLPDLHGMFASSKMLTSNPTDIRTWFSNVEQHATEGVNKILIGNKCDWEEKRAVSTEQGQALADELGIPFMEVSAKGNINVEKAFFSLATDIKKRIVDTSQPQQAAPQGGVQVGGASAMGTVQKNCC